MRNCTIFLAALSLAFAPAPFPRPDPSKEDLKKLQGTWLKVYSVPAGNGENEGLLVIAKQRMSYTLPGMPTGEYEFQVNAKKKPKLFDFKGTGGLVQGNEYRGIYELDGDTLKFCYVMTAIESERPGSFKAAGDGVVNPAADSPVILSVYKRQKR